jgi:hypothetical protein
LACRPTVACRAGGHGQRRAGGGGAEEDVPAFCVALLEALKQGLAMTLDLDESCYGLLLLVDIHFKRRYNDTVREPGQSLERVGEQ